MKKTILFCLSLFLFGCKFYSFTGASIPENAETVQVNLFTNDAANSIGSVFEPGLDRDFKCHARGVTKPNEFRIDWVNGDLIYEGEITEYQVTPTTATAQQTAAQNRLTISINVRYINSNNEEDNFEKDFHIFMILQIQHNYKL